MYSQVKLLLMGTPEGSAAVIQGMMEDNSGTLSEPSTGNASMERSGIIEYACEFDKVDFGILDVSRMKGTTSRKWIHCFEGVFAVIFSTSLNDYDQVTEGGKNKLRENMNEFDAVCNNVWFTKTSSIILLLTERNLFDAKIADSPLTVCFPEYKGGKGKLKAAEYIKQRFEELLKRNFKEEKQMYSRITQDSDAGMTHFVISSIKDVIIIENLKHCGLLAKPKRKKRSKLSKFTRGTKSINIFR